MVVARIAWPSALLSPNSNPVAGCTSVSLSSMCTPRPTSHALPAPFQFITRDARCAHRFALAPLPRCDTECVPLLVTSILYPPPHRVWSPASLLVSMARVVDEVSITTSVLAEDDGADMTAVVQSHDNVRMAVRRRALVIRIARRWRLRGSIVGSRGNKRRDFSAGVQAIRRDYFGVGGLKHIYDERDFETWFRVRRVVFLRVYLAFKDKTFFHKLTNAPGKLKEHPLERVMAPFRVIAEEEAADRAN